MKRREASLEYDRTINNKEYWEECGSEFKIAISQIVSQYQYEVRSWRRGSNAVTECESRRSASSSAGGDVRALAGAVCAALRGAESMEPH